MATIQKPSYGASVALAVTNLHSLASHATNGWQSASVDNTADLALGVLITVTIVLVAGAPAADKTVYVYVYESEDGTNFTDNATGAQAALTRRDPTNMRLIGTIACPDSGGLTYKQVFTYAPPVMPRKWGVYLNNVTNVALASSGNAVSYTPIQGQSA
jgi:hypothetical protein